MATITDTAAEVAQAVLDLHGDYDQYPELREALLAAARDAAVMMSQRLGKSIDSERFLEETIAFQGKSMTMAQGYIQVIVLAGYAAFFALWSSMASQIPVVAMLASGALMAVSILVFIGWTVIGMFFVHTATVNTLQVYQQGPVDFWTRFQSMEISNLARRATLMRFWKPVVYAAGGTALVSALILAISGGTAFVTKAMAEHRTAAERLANQFSPVPSSAAPAQKMPNSAFACGGNSNRLTNLVFWPQRHVVAFDSVVMDSTGLEQPAHQIEAALIRFMPLQLG